jgi:hypothetical protein
MLGGITHELLGESKLVDCLHGDVPDEDGVVEDGKVEDGVVRDD